MAIALHKSHNKIFVWSSRDVIELRKNHHIVGNLVGSLAKFPHQSLQLGLPLQLMHEEAALLLDKGICSLVKEDGVSPSVPTEHELKSYHEYLEKSYQEQVAICRNKKIENIKSHMGEIVQGRKLKNKHPNMPVEENSEDIIRNMNIPDIPRDHSRILLYTRNPKIEDKDLSDLRFPVTKIENLRYRVFRHFWDVGNFITGGSKFGGDFLIYGGDPVICHSSYIAVCVDHHDVILPRMIVTLGRLATNVKKVILFCSLDDCDELCITSLRWSGIK